MKQDKFAAATANSMGWLSGHRSGVLRWIIGAALVLLVIIAALVFWSFRSSAADKALGAALDVYTNPLAVPGAPAEKNVYNNAADRAKEANRQFTAVAHDYGSTAAGAKAHYFAGITFEELNQNASAETELKAASGAWDHNLSNLAKVALAGLYHQTGRDAQAIDLYNELIKKPSLTVSAGVAQLDLADLYAATGKTDQARALWAKVKDSDKDGMAGSLAAQKLTGKQ